MKKFFAVSMTVVALFLNSACTKPKTVTNEKLKIVTTIFPVYDWAREIIGEHAELTLLLDNGVDLHNFQPTANDITKIANADLFIYIGGESDEWVHDALSESVNKNITALHLLDALGNRAKPEEHVEGMEVEHEHDHDEHDHDDHETAHNHEHDELDEHIWLSLKNAGFLCAVITDALCELDKANESSYRKNYTAYNEKLTALDSAYTDAVSHANSRTLLVADRFPFRYLVDDYGLTYYAAFSGCSAETEASFKTIAFLSGKVDELSLKSICALESSDKKIASTIVENSKEKNAGIFTLDSMQSTTRNDIKNGATYLGIMEKNLAALQLALNY